MPLWSSELSVHRSLSCPRSQRTQPLGRYEMNTSWPSTTTRKGGKSMEQLYLRGHLRGRLRLCFEKTSDILHHGIDHRNQRHSAHRGAFVGRTRVCCRARLPVDAADAAIPVA